MSDLLNEPVYTETQTLTVVPLLDTILEVHEEALIDQKLADREQRLNALSHFNHGEAIEDSIQANVINEDVMKKIPIDLFKSTSTSSDNLTEYELKHKLYDIMQKSRSFLTHDKHLDPYNALINSMKINKLVAKGELDLSLTLKKRSYDDQDPPEKHDGENKKRRLKDVGESSSMKEKALEDSSDFERFVHADEPRQEKKEEVHHDAFSGKHAHWFKQLGEKKIEELPEQSWFNELVDAKKDSWEHELQIGMFAKSMKNFLNKDKITKEDLEEPAFELLKNMFKNSIELEYDKEKCYLAMTDRINWPNPKGDRFYTDLSKPLSLEGPPGRKTILTRYFFNKDLKYLMHGNQEKKYALSLSEIKATRYEQEVKIISVQRILVDKWYGYGYLKEIFVKRADQKEYMFVEAYFLRLNQNNIKDLYLLKIQDRIHNLLGVDEFDLKKCSTIPHQKNRDQEKGRRCTAGSAKLSNKAQLDKTTVHN
ncbi:hypothetical protein Tco_1468083 [Tanacetum coccineum]